MLLRLIYVLPLLLAACSDSPDDRSVLSSGEGVLAYVPADTPYFFAAAKPLPDEVRNELGPHIEAVVQSYRKLLQAAAAPKPDQQTEGRSGSYLDKETRQRISATIEELAGMVTTEGIPEAGINRDSTAAVYGVGLLPVVRVTLSDGALFESTMEKLESRAGEKMNVATVDGHAYRYAGDDEGRLIVAVIDDQLVVSVVPADLPETLLKSVLGIDLPTTNIAESGVVAALADRYGYQPYGLGAIDIDRIAAIFLDEPDAVNRELLALTDYDAASLTDVCKSEIRSIAGIAPRVVTGYTDITGEHIRSNTVLELRDDLATGVQTLTAAVPGLGAEQGGLFSFGMSLNMPAAREFYSARLEALEAEPYDCELLADLQAGVPRARELLDQPVPPIVYGFRGFLAVIDDIKGLDVRKQQPPTDVDMRFLVATDNAEGLLAMGAMFSPEIASLDLKADSRPVKLEIPAVSSKVDAAYVAMSENALALSFGNGSETGLQIMLGAAATEPSPFVSMGMDAGRYYGFIGDAMSLDDSDDESPELTAATAEVMKTFEKMFSRISVDINFTANGIEMPSTMELADD